ncbi:hypothetical protein TOPH_06193, partial [Tolypocladium ophioglossoides CBS 100239]
MRSNQKLSPNGRNVHTNLIELLNDIRHDLLSQTGRVLPDHSDWKLDPREDFSQVFDSEGTPQEIGTNATSGRDEAWTRMVSSSKYLAPMPIL